MAVQIQLRNDTAANWTSANPVLAVGEIGVETDTDQFKLGDGVTSWTSLGYGGIQGPAGDDGITSVSSPLSYDSETKVVSIDLSSYDTSTEVDSKIAALVDSAPTTLDTLNELAAALGDDANFATTVTDALAGKASTSHTHAISDVTSLQTTLDAKAPLTPSVNAKTSGYTLTAADKGEVITASGTFTITVPGFVFSAGDRVDIVNIGTGVITIAGSGATIYSKDSAVTIDSQYAGATVLFGSTTVAYLIGAIA